MSIRRQGFIGSWQFAAGAITMLGALSLTAVALGRDSARETAAQERFMCTVTQVHDGDGPIWCRETDGAGKPIKIRLSAVAARELDETCSQGHPCPAASGAAAKAELTRLAIRQTLRCEPTGMSYGRVTAWCWRQDGLELNCAMVKSGKALRWDKFDRDRRMCS